jgi:hypothetical protein
VAAVIERVPKGGIMGLSRRVVILLASLAVALPAVAQDVYVYPTRGQSPQQQDKDKYDCHGWATQQTGFDPSRPAAAAPLPPPPPPVDHSHDGSILRTTGRGAAVGAIGGAIGGNAGKGAAIGAATGALVGGVRRRDRIRQEEANQQAYQSQAQYAQSQANATNAAGRNNYNRALATCLQGRGYTVN